LGFTLTTGHCSASRHFVFWPKQTHALHFNHLIGWRQYGGGHRSNVEGWLPDRLPELQLDNRETIGARLISPSELRGMALTGPVAVYLGRTIPPSCHSECPRNALAMFTILEGRKPPTDASGGIDGANVDGTA
jgi:hypothetical protein